jgi:hypothetical protein
VSGGCRGRSGAVSGAGVGDSCANGAVSTKVESSGVRELSWISNVASLFGKFDCETEVTCGEGNEPSVNNLEPGVICDVGETEDIRG